ncbi:unnamed protein product [Prunus armeniaca]
MEITGRTMVWGQTGVETRRSLTVHVLKVQVEGLNYLDWGSRTEQGWCNCEARTRLLLGGLFDQQQRFCVALVRIRAELGVGGEDDGDGASDGVIVAIPQRKLLEQAIVALQVVDEGSGLLL